MGPWTFLFLILHHSLRGGHQVRELGLGDMKITTWLSKRTQGSLGCFVTNWRDMLPYSVPLSDHIIHFLYLESSCQNDGARNGASPTSSLPLTKVQVLVLLYISHSIFCMHCLGFKTWKPDIAQTVLTQTSFVWGTVLFSQKVQELAGYGCPSQHLASHILTRLWSGGLLSVWRVSIWTKNYIWQQWLDYILATCVVDLYLLHYTQNIFWNIYRLNWQKCALA